MMLKHTLTKISPICDGRRIIFESYSTTLLDQHQTRAKNLFILFVCWVICFLSQNETSKMFPEVALTVAVYLRNTH